MSFLRKLSVFSFAISSLLATNAGATVATVAHHTSPTAISSHLRHRARQPSPASPILALPASVRRVFECIMWYESRSTLAHPNLRDNNAYGSSGVFQIEQGTWAAHQTQARVPGNIHVWQASYAQQVQVAVAIWRADGFGPWSTWRLCR